MLRFLFLAALAVCARADSFDQLRLKWRQVLTGGEAVDRSAPQIKDRLGAIESIARSNWRGMQKEGPALWTDLGSATSSSQITSAWNRLKSMALAWATPGQALYNHDALLADIRAGMEWMERNRYSARVKSEYDNWWDWEIGTPLQLGDLLTLLYDRLTPDEIGRYTQAVDRFVADPRIMIVNTVSTGANRVWKCKGAVLRAIAAKDAAKLQLASDALSPVFAYVTSGDGFYEDGSFIQHRRHPYTGGYGNALISELADLMYLLAGSNWQVRDPAASNLYRWIFDSFEPVIYRGAMLDMLRGREMSRSGSTDHAAGHSAAAAILRISEFAPGDAAARMRAMLKGWYTSDTSRDWASGRSIDQIARIGKLLGDDTVEPRGALTGSWIFAGMDRVVHRRPGWAFAIAMHSTRIYNYESINNENLRAWHTGDGMTYLYTGDLTQFSNGFWPTVDPQRLPGTTVIAGSTARQSQTGGSDIAGGAAAAGLAAVMMRLGPDGRQLDAKKSWFLFDDKVVALGSDIRADGKTVETIVENRMSPGEFTSGAKWAHIAGAGGYWFPNGAGWKSLRETRTGAWHDINRGGSSTPITRTYQTIWFDEGDSYAYALLPAKTRAEMESYEPDFEIVQNSPAVHAVAQRAAGILAANFWQPATVAGIACDQAASVVTREAGGVLEIGVADPAQSASGIHLEVGREALAVLERDGSVTVEQLTPAVKLTVAVKGARGRTVTVKLATGPRP